MKTERVLWMERLSTHMDQSEDYEILRGKNNTHSTIDHHFVRSSSLEKVSIRMKKELEDWRKHGKQRRRALLKHDEAEGGLNFELHQHVRVTKYFELADRVLQQFRSMYSSRSNMEECFVMGHRLVIFLAKALPTHPDYRSLSPQIGKLRAKSRRDLDWIHKRLDVVALRIDEDQLNRFILNDLDLDDADDDDDDEYDVEPESAMSKPEQSDRAVNVSFEKDEVPALQENLKTQQSQSIFSEPDSQWETFDGWDTTMKEATGNSMWAETTPSFDEDMPTTEKVLPKLEPRPEQRQTPEFSRKARSLSPMERSTPSETLEAPTILDEIANDEVKYEYDSEAVDSWANDDPPSPYRRRLPPDSAKAFESILNAKIATDVVQLPLSPHVSVSEYSSSESGYSPDHSASSQNNSSASTPSTQSPISPTGNKENNEIEDTENAPKMDVGEPEVASPRRRVRFNEQGNQLNFYTPDNPKRVLILPKPEPLWTR